MEIIVAILPIRADWKGLYHYLTAVFLESNYEMSSSHHDMDTETRTSRHSPDLSRSKDSSSKTALPLKNIAKSGAGANICQVFVIVIISLLLTSAQNFKWEWTWTEQISRQEFEKLIIKTEYVFGLDRNSKQHDDFCRVNIWYLFILFLDFLRLFDV